MSHSESNLNDLNSSYSNNDQQTSNGYSDKILLNSLSKIGKDPLDIKSFQIILQQHRLQQLKLIDWSSIRHFDELELLQTYDFNQTINHTLIDVGAFIGYSALSYAQKGWRIVSFEADPENYGTLCNTLKGFNKATCIPKAVSLKTESDVPFYKSTDHWAIHSLKPFHPTHQFDYTVDTTRLDDALDELEIDSVSFLKIDIEGADYHALKSFDFKRYHPEVVLCEYMDDRSEKHFGYNHHNMVSFMSQYGYTAYISEWAEIKEYARKGVPTSHQFLRCVPYPLDSSPAWGNLIFIDDAKAPQFIETLLKYLKNNCQAKFIALSSSSEVNPPETTSHQAPINNTEQNDSNINHSEGKVRIMDHKYRGIEKSSFSFGDLNIDDLDQLPLIWKDCEQKYLPPDYKYKSHKQFLNETMSQLKSDSKPVFLIYWLAAGILKFYIPNRELSDQISWLRRFIFLLYALEERCKSSSSFILEVHEQYCLSSFRYCIAKIYLKYDIQDKALDDYIFNIHNILIKISTWKIGCIDEHDVDLLEDVKRITSCIKPGSSISHAEYLPYMAFALFREPYRLALELDSDMVFSSYLLHRFKNDYKENNSNFFSKIYSNENHQEEYDLWYLENYENISSYRNRHRGETCFIIGNGPSLNKMDLKPLRNCFTFGLNKIHLLFDKIGFQTSYLVATNTYVIQQSAKEFSALSMPQFITMWGRDFMPKRKDILFLRDNQAATFFQQDITHGVCIDCTVTYVAMQIAYYLGFSTVILIGVDHSFSSKGQAHATVTLNGDDPNHFDPSYFGYGQPWQLPDLQGSEYAYKNAKTVFEADGRTIVDATVDGKLDIFQKITYKEALLLI